MNDLRVYDSILDLLPNEQNPTPLVRLNRVTGFRRARVYAKLEWYNPFGAVKDRIAANMLREAGAVGKLVEPTSGNTGLALAMLANARGVSLRTPLSSAIPIEKRTMLRFFGAGVIELSDSLCPAPGAPEGAIAEAARIARDEPDTTMLNQYENDANPDAHYRTTGPEIWRQTEGAVTHFVAGLGTCGTLTGTGRFLKERGPVRVIGVHPEEGHDIPGVRSIRQLAQTRFFRPEEYDGTVEIADRDAYDLCLRINREESVIAGPSSGMALAGALRTVPDEAGVLAVVIFPDNAFKYASSFARHFPDLAPTPAAGGALIEQMIENSKNPYDQILASTVESRRRDFLILDVRESAHYASGHVPGAVNIPLDDLGRRLGEIPENREAPIVTVCGTGRLSITAMLILKSRGYKNVRNLRGGTEEWAAKGLALAP